MFRERTGLLAATALGLAAAARAQDGSGSIADDQCRQVIMDNGAVDGELYAVKIHNPGGGPDEHTDWLFDVSAKGGARIPGVSVGGPTYDITDVWARRTTPPERMFVVITYPNGWVAIDGTDVRSGAAMGTVNRQHVGDSLPVGVDAGIGLVLSGDGAPYSVGGISTQGGGDATFPFGTNRGIEVAFAPLAEVNPTEISPGCTIGSEVVDDTAGFGLIVGYNVYRRDAATIAGTPTPADFVGYWEYYIPYDSFDLNVADQSRSSADTDGDTVPDRVLAASDGQPNDLAGLQNPDGLPYTGDEVLIFQDSATNPDGSPRLSGTGPEAGHQYWYAFQPVAFTGRSTLQFFDGLGWGRDNAFPGIHAVDWDADGVIESIDLDIDGSPEFYSPQAAVGITGLGLTNGGLPLLSSVVLGSMNPAVAGGGLALTGRPTPMGVDLTLAVGFERPDVTGYNVHRHDATTNTLVRVNRAIILAQGGEAATYHLTDSFGPYGRRLRSGTATYMVETVRTDGNARILIGPFLVQLGSARFQRR